MVGKGRKVVEDAAARRALEIAQQFFQASKVSTDSYNYGCLNADFSKIVFQDGTEADVVIRGTPPKCGPCRKLPDGRYLIEGNYNKIIQVDSVQSVFCIVSGDGNIPASAPNIYIIKTDDASKTYKLPVDPLISIFTDFTNSDPDTPQHYGGAYYSNLSPDRSQLGVVRLISQFGGARINNEAGTPLPKIQVYWALYKGIGFNSNTSQITYSSVVNGAYELPFNTTVANTVYLSQFLLPGYRFGCPGSRGLILSSYMEVEPLMAWDSSNNFSFDLIGVSLSGGSRESALISTCTAPEFVQATATNLIYGRNMQNGGSLTIGPVAYCDPGQMGADGTGGFAQSAGYYCVTQGSSNSTFLAFKDPSTGAGANISIDINTDHIGYCSPYGVEVADVTSLVGFGNFLAAIDTERYYLPDPLWTDLFPSTDGGFLKVTSNRNFLGLRTKDNGNSTVTPSITAYSYNPLTTAISKGKVSTGKTIPSSFIGTPMDWR